MEELDSMAKDVPNGQTLQEQRRRFAVKEGMDMRDMDEIPQFVPSRHEGSAFERHIPGQNYVLYSISSSGLAPISLTPGQPNVRFYGAFASKHDAISFSAIVRGVDPHCSILVHPTGVWGLVAKNAEALANSEPLVKERLECYDAFLHNAWQDFDTNLRKKSQGHAKLREPDSVVELRAPPDESIAYQRHLGGNARLQSQNFAVVSFIRDMQDSEEAQPVFMVHAFFETTNDADRYVRDTLSLQMTDIDLDVVSAGEWISPQNAADHPNCIYRDDELHKIMENQRKEPGRVARFNSAMASLPAPKKADEAPAPTDEASAPTEDALAPTEDTPAPTGTLV